MVIAIHLSSPVLVSACINDYLKYTEQKRCIPYVLGKTSILIPGCISNVFSIETSGKSVMLDV